MLQTNMPVGAEQASIRRRSSLLIRIDPNICDMLAHKFGGGRPLLNTNLVALTSALH